MFQEIKRYFHLADNNNLVEDDKLAKIRKYLNLLKRNFTQFRMFSQSLSINEQMVPYYTDVFPQKKFLCETNLLNLE